MNTAVPAPARDHGASPPRPDTPGAPGRPGGPGRLRQAPRLVRRLALATLLANVGIVATGAAVRLTSSGLGCPTWPRCTDDSFTVTAAHGIHGAVEFGNRLLAVALLLTVAATLVVTVVQRPRRPALVTLAAAALLGIVGQAVLGGITVLTGLNPYTVAAHFLLSTVLIYAAYALWHRSGEGDGPRRWVVARPLVWLARAVLAAAALVIAAGTLVTGSGPHSGDEAAARTGFDPAAVSMVHTNLVFVLVGLTIAALFAVRAVAAPASHRRAVAVLLAVEAAQGTIGYVQYFTGLPVVLVGAHVLGAAVLWVAACRVLFTVRVRPVG